VRARPGFGLEPSLMPSLSWGEEAVFPAATAERAQPLGLYAIVDSATRVRQVLAAGVRTVQLRIKTGPPEANELHEQIDASVRDCRAAGAELFVNDHWQLAVELGAPGVHLGQEDVLALGESGRATLAASGVALGISSHSLWELARARALAPRYIACGPVWPTLTKAMPWKPQGLDNLRWWSRMAGHPVVAIGGILATEQAELAAASGGWATTRPPRSRPFGRPSRPGAELRASRRHCCRILCCPSRRKARSQTWSVGKPSSSIECASLRGPAFLARSARRR
jgi:thiamine-phosphate diphosphorylase